MREIKFRVWDKTRKNMEHSLFGAWSAYCLENGKLKEVAGPAGEEWPEDTDDVLMQYTGLKDVNNVDIFEGDICKVVYADGENIYAVEFDNGTFYIGNESLGMNFAKCEVIGNIYENKRLLK